VGDSQRAKGRFGRVNCRSKIGGGGSRNALEDHERMTVRKEGDEGKKGGCLRLLPMGRSKKRGQ